jgi:hypothetical protein
MFTNRKPSAKAKAIGAVASGAALLLTAAPGAALAAGDTIVTTNRPIPYTGDKNAGNPPVGADRMYRTGNRARMHEGMPMKGALRKGPTMANRVHVANGVPFACTGIAETKSNPRWQRFPLRLVYAAGPRGALLSDVRTHIRDHRGATVMRVHCTSSPWLVARLQPGRYSVTATNARGITRRAAFRVPARGQKRVIVRFPGNY